MGNLIRKKEGNCIIEILKYGNGAINEGVTFLALKTYLHSLGYRIDDYRLFNYFINLYEAHEQEYTGSISLEQLNDEKLNIKFSLSSESLFNFIEHEEFKAAASSSKWAMRFASLALLMSLMPYLIKLMDILNP